MAKINITTSISQELWHKAKENNIQWAEALRIGVTYLISCISDSEYNNPIQLQRKIQNLAIKLDKVCKENEKLKK